MSSRKQTRRSVSISGELYDKLKAFCQAEGTSMSGMVETLCRGSLHMDPPILTRPPGKYKIVRTTATATVRPSGATVTPSNMTIIPAGEKLGVDNVEVTLTGSPPKRIVDTSTRQPKIDPDEVGKALGATRVIKKAVEPTFGMSKEEREARKVKTVKPGDRSGNIFTF